MSEDDRVQVVKDDPWLGNWNGHLKWRLECVHKKKQEIIEKEGSLLEFAQGYKKFGFNVTDKGIMYREWAPSARNCWLFGDFNEWNRTSHQMTRDDFGVWSIFLPHVNGLPAIPHNSKIKILVETPDGHVSDRIPAWIKRVDQPKDQVTYDGVFWNPAQQYEWKHQSPPRPDTLLIYESHVGMATEHPRIGTYREFKDTVLPYVKDLGYNTIQLMAIMEHVYYASFGYQVTNFFAISSRFGTPEELKEMIDEAHRLGLTVLLDIVHSHASKNVHDGLNMFDGSLHQYFHDGGKGFHPLWDSRLFNYHSWEVMRFLLSNVNWYLEEYKFDGFRFDGVTSMIYHHHGIAHPFVDGYSEYFPPHTDEEALLYLTLANDFIHTQYPHAVVIAEDVSGFPGLCRPVEEGGIGFDYRLAMAIPDKWIELLKELKDEDWDMSNIVHTLTNRRFKEATIAYCESHDQALVGDKTLAFWLMDKEMYHSMSVISQPNLIVDRGLSLHKMIRLITFGLGGEAYLTFMGNEFGHPEWIDFPREGNGNSYHYCRRRWDLVRDPLLKYKDLHAFDRAMVSLEQKYHFMKNDPGYVSCKHQGDKVITFERGGLLWVFNFHHHNSFTDYRVGVNPAGKYKVILDTDQPVFGGHGRIDTTVDHFTEDFAFGGRERSVLLYIPSRCALVLARQD